MRASSTRACRVEGEYYWRWLSNFTGVNTERHRQHQRPRLSAADVGDGRSQGSSAVLRRLADIRPLRRPVGSARRRELVLDEGARDSPQRRMDVRERIPVGYTAYPYPVGAKGTVFHINLEMNF